MEEKFNNSQEERQFKQFQEYQKRQEEEKKKKRKKGWLYGCGGCLVLLILIIVGISACTATFIDSDSGNKDTSKKIYKIGDTVKKDGIEVTITSVEYASASNEFSTEPENGKAIKVNFKFKNNNDDQVLLQDNDFTCKVNGENYEQWFGSGDDKATFSHQLNKGNTASGYIYYDVPDSSKYTIEMDATPGMENIKAKWDIDSSEIK